jgi:hypothetical protein
MPGPPKLELIAPGASPVEAAAVVAALERFMRDVHASAGSSGDRRGAGRWAIAAMLEGVGDDDAPDFANPWINT